VVEIRTFFLVVAAAKKILKHSKGYIMHACF